MRGTPERALDAFLRELDPFILGHLLTESDRRRRLPLTLAPNTRVLGQKPTPTGGWLAVAAPKRFACEPRLRRAQQMSRRPEGKRPRNATLHEDGFFREARQCVPTRGHTP